MKKPLITLLLTATLSITGVAILPAHAFFDNVNNNPATGAKLDAKRVVACTLVKASYKGENEGFLSDAQKSLEGYCQDRSGKLIEFSATMDQWEKLLSSAGKRGIAYLSDLKISDMKSDWLLTDFQPTDTKPIQMKKLCGPAQGQKLLGDKKVWSRGFRVAHLYDANQTKKGWQLNAYVGDVGSTPWTEKGTLLSGDFCKIQIPDLMNLNQPLVYTYVQPKEEPDYFIEAVYQMIIQ